MLVEDIKIAQVASRKARDNFRTGVLTTLLGEVEKIGKDAGNRLTKDDECKKVIKKFIKNINDTLKLTDKNSTALNNELVILSEFLPKEMSDEELTTVILGVINSMKNNGDKVVIGTVMKVLKATHDNFDGKIASQIIRNEIG